MKIGFKFLVLAVLLSASSAFAQVDIGNGFSCSGSSILKNGQEVQFSKAKSNIQKTINKLKSKLETAAPKKKAAIRAKIKAANNDKKELKACFSGTLAPNQVDPIFTQLAAGNGTYTGSYSGTVAGFPVSGAITMQFVLDGTNFSALFSIGGSVGSALDAKPLSFTNNVGGVGFPAQFFLADTFLGDVTLSVTQSGQLTVTNSNTDVGSVTFSGQFASQTITSSLSGTYKGIPFSGTANLVRQ